RTAVRGVRVGPPLDESGAECEHRLGGEVPVREVLMSSRILVAVLCALVGAATLFAQEKPGSKEEKEQAELARLQKLVSETQVDASKLDKEMPLIKFLAAVEELLPKDRKVSLRLDKTALGKDYAKVADAPIRGADLKAPLSTLLRKALSQSPVEVAYAIRPT